MNTNHILIEKIRAAAEDLEQAKLALIETQRHYRELQHFHDETKMVSTEINVVNSEGLGNSLSVMTAFYKLHGYMMLFTVTELDEAYIGTIIDYTERAILFSCEFYEEFGEKQELFNRLVAEYAKWRFDL